MTKTEKMNRLYVKTQERLNELQKHCTARTMDIKDIKNLVQDAQTNRFTF